MIVEIDRSAVAQAAKVHSISWKESHRAFCAPDFVARHTIRRQEKYLLDKMSRGSKIYMLVEDRPLGIVSVNGSLIEDLYVLPDAQGKGVGTKLLRFAVEKCVGTPVLWILENNAAAKRFYVYRGFVETGRVHTVPNGLAEIELVHSPAGTGSTAHSETRREDKQESKEIWDLYDERRSLTGRDHIRGEKIPQGYYHLVVHVWIRNSRGEYLISRRSADRPRHPLKWECVGGSALKGEDSLSAAIRETQEEVGLTLSPNDGRLIRSMVGRVVNEVKFSDIVDVWLFACDGPVSLEKATTAEVEQSAWLNKEQIRTLYDKGDLVDTLGYFFETSDLQDDTDVYGKGSLHEV